MYKNKQGDKQLLNIITKDTKNTQHNNSSVYNTNALKINSTNVELPRLPLKEKQTTKNNKDEGGLMRREG